VIVLRLLRLLVAGGIRPVEDAPAMLRRDPPRLFQEDVRIASEPEAPHASLVPVIQRERLATGGGHANREAGHQRVEHLEALPVQVKGIEIANGSE